MHCCSNWASGCKANVKQRETEMKTIKIMACLALAAAVWLPFGCTADSEKQVSDGSSHFPHVKKTGAQIWAENCTRCHNPRPAVQYSAQQWDMITTHMRLRADLNGEEQRAIYHFMWGM